MTAFVILFIDQGDERAKNARTTSIPLSHQSSARGL